MSSLQGECIEPIKGAMTAMKKKPTNTILTTSRLGDSDLEDAKIASHSNARSRFSTIAPFKGDNVPSRIPSAAARSACEAVCFRAQSKVKVGNCRGGITRQSGTR